MKRILIVTDLHQISITFDMLNKILPLDKLNLKKIYFLKKIPYDDSSNELSNHNIKTEIIQESNFKISQILRIEKNKNIRLIIIYMTKRPLTPFIQKLIKKSSTPILFFNSQEHIIPPGSNIFDHIVFATDWSEGSEKALNFLLTFKHLLGEMEIVNVINKKLTIKDMRELKERIAKTRKRFLNEDIDAEAHIYAGKTADEILLAAKDYKSTIIIVGSSSKEKSIKKYFKKSSSYIVAEKSNLPVLVIP